MMTAYHPQRREPRDDCCLMQRMPPHGFSMMKKRDDVSQHSHWATSSAARVTWTASFAPPVTRTAASFAPPVTRTAASFAHPVTRTAASLAASAGLRPLPVPFFSSAASSTTLLAPPLFFFSPPEQPLLCDPRATSSGPPGTWAIWEICTQRAGKLYKARSPLHRSRFCIQILV